LEVRALREVPPAALRPGGRAAGARRHRRERRAHGSARRDGRAPVRLAARAQDAHHDQRRGGGEAHWHDAPAGLPHRRLVNGEFTTERRWRGGSAACTPAGGGPAALHEGTACGARSVYALSVSLRLCGGSLLSGGEAEAGVAVAGEL